jgi:hypothetical protein
MKLARRKFLHLAAGATAMPVVSRVAKAQAYPTTGYFGAGFGTWSVNEADKTLAWHYNTQH